MLPLRFFIEYRDTDMHHSAGMRQAVDSPETLLGRDPDAAVCFGDDCPTVSRRHARIVREGNGYILEPLSRTNSTMVNGRKIYSAQPLHDGDMIRLSTDGPSIRFIFPAGAPMVPPGYNDAVLLLPGQTPPPPPVPGRYGPGRVPPVAPSAGGGKPGGNRNHALWIAGACLLLIALGFGIWKIVDLTRTSQRLDALVAEQLRQKQEADSLALLAHQRDSIAAAQGLGGEMTVDAQAGIGSYVGSVSATPSPASVNPNGSASASAMQVADKSVYYVMSLGFEVTTPEGRHYEISCGDGEGEISGWSGTGFLLSDGRFVTARHVVEPWFFVQSEEERELLELNILASNGGKIVSYIGAVSPTGDRLTFKSTDCSISRRGDVTRRLSDGEMVTLASSDTRDFATVHVGRTGGLPFSADASRNLRRGTKLTVLSFPLGLGANSYNDIRPVYGSATVAADGLQDGMILTTETTYEKGSSGGPVFITDSSGRLVVVGITSAIAGRSTGFIEPISSIR